MLVLSVNKVCALAIDLITMAHSLLGISDSDISDCITGDVRLIGGTTSAPNEGTVEVCINRVWATICDDGWNTDSANIVCNQLGFYPFGNIS